MSIPALSTAAFTQYVAASSNIAASQRAFQSLQQGLAAGNLAAAQLAFETYQSLNQNLTPASAGSRSSQLQADLTTLGTALDAGDLAASRNAFAAVQKDLKSSPSQAVTAAETAAAQTVNEIIQLFGSGGTSSKTSADPIVSLLSRASGLNSASNSDPHSALLQGLYGPDATSVQPESAFSNGSVNVYA